MSDQRCENCRYFYMPDGTSHTRDGTPVEKGLCRRYPPTLIAEVATHFGNDRKSESDYIYSELESYFPEAHKADWCGEYSPNDADGVLNTDHPS